METERKIKRARENKVILDESGQWCCQVMAVTLWLPALIWQGLGNSQLPQTILGFCESPSQLPGSQGQLCAFTAGHVDTGHCSLCILRDASKAAPFQISEWKESTTPALWSQGYYPCPGQLLLWRRADLPPTSKGQQHTSVADQGFGTPGTLSQQWLVRAGLDIGHVSTWCIHCKNLFRDFLSWSEHPENHN